MKCPVCGTPDLLMTERQGVEIDYCPSCRGVWLDRGELDKLIERTDDMVGRPAQTAREGALRSAHQDARHRDHRDEYQQRNMHHGDDTRRRHYDQPRKKKSLFEMFDFD